MMWPVLPLFRLCRIETGRTPSRVHPEFFGGDNVWVTIADLNDTTISESKEHVTDDAVAKARMRPVPAGTVLLSYKLSLGKLGITETSLYTNEAIAALSPQPGIDFIPKFLFYALRTVDYLALCHGAVKGKCLNRASLSLIPVPYPPLSEQRRIVEILDQADALRKKRAEADAKAACILPALFYKMFGDPATNPKGWRIKPLSDLEAHVRYGLGQPPKTSETGIALIRATNISSGTISVINMIYVDPQDVPPGRNAFLKEDEVIVVRSGAYTGDVAQVTKEWEGCVAGYDLVITPGKCLTGEFVEAYLLTSFIQKGYFQNLKTRAGQPHLNAAQVVATPFLDVPYELQMRFSEAVQSMRVLRKKIATANENLDRAFAVMLHQAFTGDLTSRWREAHIKELLTEMEQQAKFFAMTKNGV